MYKVEGERERERETETKREREKHNRVTIGFHGLPGLKWQAADQ